MSERIDVDSSVLHGLYVRLMVALGVPEGDARIVADSLRYADLRGIDTHGAARLPIYASRIMGGGTNPDPTMRVVSNGAVYSLDAGEGLGQVAGYRAMEEAVRRSRDAGIAMTTVRNSNHLGTLGFFAEMAVPGGIGYALSGVASTLVAPGAGRPVLGSNPWALAVPTASEQPLVVDMAMGETITPALRRAVECSTPIPTGLAVDRSGSPTTDPAQALAGGILPIGGYKGFALTLVLEVLASVLPGAAYSDDIPDFESGRTDPKRLGHLFVAIDVDQLPDAETFLWRVGDFLSRVRASGAGEPIRLPGDRRHQVLRQRMSEGVPIESELAAEIGALAHRLGVRLPW